jgi:tetratricopeptide (TPR) repeat protein
VELSDQFNFFLDDERFKKENQEPYFPSNKWKLTVDSADVVNKGVVSAADASKIVPVMRWERNGKLLKNSILVYDIIRNNNWERPIYFASTIGQDAFNGLQDYFQLEGLAYRLVPVKTVSQNPLQVGRVNTEDMYDNVMNKFKWGNMQDTVMDIYLDENNLRMVSNLRMQFANLADALTEEGQKDKAVIVLDKCFEVMPEEVVRYDEQILYLAEEYVEAGEKEKGTALFERYFELIEEKLDYLESLDPNEVLSVVGDFERDFTVLSYTLRRTSDTVKDSVFLNQIGGRFESNYENYLRIEATKRKEYEERRSGKKGDF